MENNDQRQNWTDERMSMLQPSEEWQPDTVRGIARFRQRQGATGYHPRRWAAVMAAGVITAGGLMAYPASRAFAQRCVAACSNEAAALHHALEDFHRNPSISKLHYD